MTFDIGAWEAFQGSPPPISGSGTTSTTCIGVTPAQLTVVRDQILAAMAPLATKADLTAAKNEILAAIAAIPTAPPVTTGYAKVGSVQYPNLTDAAMAVAEGGVVEIYGEMRDLKGSAGFLKSCTIRGMTPDAKLNWTLGTAERMAFGKGLIVCAGSGKTYVIENLELCGARVPEANGSGVRGDDAASITVRNCNIHDNENGVLSVAVVQNYQGNTFANNGNAAGSSHHIYAGGGDLVTAEGNIFYAAIKGNQFKSRAKKTVFRHNMVAELIGSGSWQVDLPFGGDCLIEKNTIEQGPNAENRSMISYAPEGFPHPVNALAIRDNNIINDHAQPGWGVILVQQPSTIEIVRNTFVGPFAETVMNGTLDGTNSVFPDRAAAGYAAYPFLPPVPA